ncbi:MAG: VOC family protein [Caulobacteraceae bacterium]|nr:VOC family protein [Caulobacteraceae bacterium]
MKIQALGHVVLKVADVARAEQFYNGLLGLPICARLDQGGMSMTFFTLGDHHNFAVAEAAGAQKAPAAVGLHHVAFKIGDSMDQLREAKTRLDAAGVGSVPMDHEVTKSLYLEDPDGNGVELYVDVSDVWRKEPQRVAYAAPLKL